MARFWIQHEHGPYGSGVWRDYLGFHNLAMAEETWRAAENGRLRAMGASWRFRLVERTNDVLMHPMEAANV